MIIRVTRLTSRYVVSLAELLKSNLGISHHFSYRTGNPGKSLSSRLDVLINRIPITLRQSLPFYHSWPENNFLYKFNPSFPNASSLIYLFPYCFKFSLSFPYSMNSPLQAMSSYSFQFLLHIQLGTLPVKCEFLNISLGTTWQLSKLKSRILILE